MLNFFKFMTVAVVELLEEQELGVPSLTGVVLR